MLSAACGAFSLICSKDMCSIWIPPGTSGHFQPRFFHLSGLQHIPVPVVVTPQVQVFVLPIVELEEVQSSRNDIKTDACSWHFSKKRVVFRRAHSYLFLPAEVPDLQAAVCIKWNMKLLFLYQWIRSQTLMLMSRQRVKYLWKKHSDISIGVDRTIHTYGCRCCRE